MSKTTTLFLTLLVLHLSGYSQSLTAVIVDSATQKPIPYVTVQLKNKGIITNEEGRFTFQLNKAITPTDSLFISCIGYASIKKPIEKFTENTIYLSAKAIELNPVIVSNKTFSAEEIIEKTVANINANYNLGLTKKRLFYRETYGNRTLKSDYTIKKSTIPEFNTSFFDELIRKAPKSNIGYIEILADYYGSLKEDEQKIELIKASELYDKSLEFKFEDLEDKFNSIIKKHVKRDSYFKVKSGLFGKKLDGNPLDSEVDSTDVAALNQRLEEEKKDKEERKKYFSKGRKEELNKIYTNIPINEDSDYNVLHKPNRYEFKINEFTYLGDDAVYVISFKPKRSEKFKGKLYINADDFALIRMDFENVKPVSSFSLLGISDKQYLEKGRYIFTKGDDEKYALSYSDVSNASRFGFKRPLKIIELNKVVKGRNKQNELAIDIDAAFGYHQRHEVVVFNKNSLSTTAYDDLKENNNVLPTYMPAYSPEFWKGYDIIEPNKAIKAFTSIDTPTTD